MANQTQADRREAGRKAAATRQRNAERAEAREQGTKAASSRQANEARDQSRAARRSLSSAASDVRSAGESIVGAAFGAGKAIVTRAAAVARGR